jgi:hypothetical protein
MIVGRAALLAPRSFSCLTGSRVSTEKFNAPSPASTISRAFPTVTPVPTDLLPSVGRDGLARGRGDPLRPGLIADHDAHRLDGPNLR